MATSRAQDSACRLVEESILELETAGRDPVYNGVVVTEDRLLVIDNNARNLHVYRRHDGKLMSTSHRFESCPRGVCLISKTDVAVCLSDSVIVILSFKYIDDVKLVKTLDVRTGCHVCNSVAKLNSSDKLFVSGWKDDGMFYWCVVNLTDGRVDSTHKVCEEGIESHLAVKDNTVYISCGTSHPTTNGGVYAYDILNPHTPKFLYQRSGFAPNLIMVDMRNFIYVSDWNSNIIHQLTDSGQLVTIHTVSSRPGGIFYDDQHGVLYTTIIGSNVITVYRMEYSHQPGVPIEILNMDDRSIQLFEEALKDGKETVYNIRIMVVGHIGVGKTTLVKRLLGEEVNISERCSTEGIDVYVNCCDVSLSNCEWTRRAKDSEQDYRLQRLARVLNEQQSVKDKANREEQVIIPPQGETTHKSQEVAHIAVEGEESELIYIRSPHHDIGQEVSPPALAQREPIQSEPNMIAMLKLLQENVYKLKQDTDKTSPLTIWDFAGQYAFYTTHQTFLTRRAIYLLVSDVSKQLTDPVADECYFDSDGIIKCKVYELIEVWLNSIHSCSSSPEARTPPVILVGTHVDKISQKQSPTRGKESETKSMTSETGEFTLPTASTLSVTTSNEQPRASTSFRAVRKFSKPRKRKGAHALPAEVHLKKQKKLRLWPRRKKTTGIGGMADVSTEIPTGEMIVDTNAEKISHHEICEKYFRKIRTYLKDKPTRFHLVDEDFAIDNTIVNSKLQDLKRKIVEVASQQPYWGEQIPARWLPLEQELMKLKAAGIKVIPRSLVENLSQAGAVKISTDELELFLRFQHDIGTILYFSMEILKDKIILDAQWMIDALKSLITAEMFVLRSIPAVADKWTEFKESGKLYPELIDALWTKEKNPDFHDNKAHILLLMEQMNIIAKPRSWSEDSLETKEENYFLVPCMLREKTPADVISPESHPTIKSSSVLCCMFTGKYLPSPIFHRLLAACITRWPIAQRNVEKLIFCGCCSFEIDHTHRLILYFREYVIFARVTKMSNREEYPDQAVCIEVRLFIDTNLSKIIGCLGSTLQYDWYIQCPKSKGDNFEKMFPVSELQKWKELPCSFHDKGHMVSSSDVLTFWFKDQAKREPITQDHINHFRLEIALRNICADALRKILLKHVPTGNADIYQAIKANETRLTTNRRLNKEQCKVVFPGPQDVGKLEDFDISLLYTLIRNVSSIPTPTTGWGNPTTDQPARDTTLEANVERIRCYRNNISGHSVDGKCSQQEFDDYWKQIEFVLNDIENALGKQGYREELEKYALWTKEKNPDFHDNKAHILLLMEQMNIIAKPRSWSEHSLETKVKRKPIIQDHINRFRLEIALCNICGEALREILLKHFPGGFTDIYQAIKANETNLTSRPLNKKQCKIVFPSPYDVGKAEDFEISLLYTLIRNVSSIPTPSTGWGNPTTDQPVRDSTLEANLERIQVYRNYISGHSVDGKCSQQEFEDFWKKIELVLSDIENALGKQG